MAFEPYTRVNFGPVKTGLKTIGYTLVKAGRPIGPRVTHGIEDLGDGHYGAAILYPSHFRGQLIWDTGGPSPQTIAFDVTPDRVRRCRKACCPGVSPARASSSGQAATHRLGTLAA